MAAPLLQWTQGALANVSTAASLQVQGTVVSSDESHWTFHPHSTLLLQALPSQGCYPATADSGAVPLSGLWTFSLGSSLSLAQGANVTLDGTACLAQQQPAVLLLQGPDSSLQLTQAGSALFLRDGAALVAQGLGAALRAAAGTTIDLGAASPARFLLGFASFFFCFSLSSPLVPFRLSLLLGVTPQLPAMSPREWACNAMSATCWS